MKTLADIFYEVGLASEPLRWRIYDTNQHNRLITDNYGALTANEAADLDNALVVSYWIKEKCIRVYIRVNK